MATTDRESSAAGTDNRPPMLVESDYESWKIRIERYIRGKPLGKLIWRSIQNGPTPHPQITVTEGQGCCLRTSKKRQSRMKLINDMKITQLDIPAHQMNTKFVNNLPPYWAKYVTNAKNNKDIFATTYVELYTYLKSYEPHAMKTLKKQEQSSSIVDPLAYIAQATPPQHAPSNTSPTLPPQPTTQSTNDAMLATMNQIVNLLSGFQKQFPPTNNQLRTSSNSRNHATMHDGQIVTETVQRRAPGNVGNFGNRGTQNYGQMTDNKGKKVICYNCHEEGHVARQCKEKKRVKDSQYFKDKMLLMEAKEKGAVLDAEAEAFLANVECTSPYDEPLAITTTNVFEVSHEDAYDSDVDDGPNATATFMANLSSTNGASTSNVNEYQIDSEVESIVPMRYFCVHPCEISMITILDNLRTQLDGHLKVNQEQSLVNDSLRAELEKCKLEMQSLERNKVKHDLDKTIVQRNKRNAELEQENVLLKSNLSKKDESINFLKTESKKVLSEKKDLEERYLEEIVCLKNANKVATEILQKFQQPTQTIPMFTKRPKLATHDLHKTALGSSNPWFAKKAKLAQPTLYNGHALLKPTHTPVRVHDSEDSLVQAEIKLVQSLEENLVKEVTEFMQIFDELAADIAKDICSIVLASDRDRPPIAKEGEEHILPPLSPFPYPPFSEEGKDGGAWGHIAAIAEQAEQWQAKQEAKKRPAQMLAG
ncbi:retrovirus-related pol polyprotein from transposon TNT 1-94 [Tanacetum coccineum]|uniref:Retrovirus-related pol polyprotein from transposon TNT 1-94 n=1 Tax=Tanacetum coccineum TaxID=301880 RepID=A0ABQ5AI70_9ASTR